jgi:hypothetical protein
MRDIIFAHNKERGKAFLDRLRGKKPLYICVVGVTETADYTRV